MQSSCGGQELAVQGMSEGQCVWIAVSKDETGTGEVGRGQLMLSLIDHVK